MSENGLEAKIARLRQEVEKLLAMHAEKLAQVASSPNGKLRELETKRAQILARRARQLDKILDTLQRGNPEQPSLDTANNAKVAVH